MWRCRLVGTQGETITEWDRELTLQGQENAELVADTGGKLSRDRGGEAQDGCLRPSMGFASQNCVPPPIEIGP